jgi:hypothetical protein
LVLLPFKLALAAIGFSIAIAVFSIMFALGTVALVLCFVF